MRTERVVTVAAIAVLCLLVIWTGCPMNDDPLPVRSDCGAAAIACYDEYATQAAGLVSFRPTSRWPRTNLTWTLAQPLPGLDTSLQIEAIERALGLWAAVSRLTFQRVDGGADISLRFESGAHGDAFPFDGPGNVLGHAFFPGSEAPGQIHLCAAENWALNPGDGQFDVFSVALHETGHALGLEHSAKEDSVMAPGYPAGGLTKLSPDDIRAIRDLYGSQDGRRAPLPAPQPGRFGPAPDLLAMGDPDSDGDGIPDSTEVFVFGTDPFSADSDGDGTNDFTEIFVVGTPADVERLADVDTDNDGVPDSLEQQRGTDPTRPDTDEDGLTDEEELFFLGTDPLDADTDDDGRPDGIEVFQDNTDPFNPDSDFDGAIDGADDNPREPIDTDQDGLPDGVEIAFFGTDPNNPDTDGDGISDGDEVTLFETDPTVPNDFNEPTFVDSDGDKLPDSAELNEFGTDPFNPDTDGDGLPDGAEVFAFTNPLNPDTDGDGITDTGEIADFDTNPNDPDTDRDGLPDGAEVFVFGTDPTRPDTDGDGVPDGAEAGDLGTDPTNPDTDGDGVHDGEEIMRGTDPLVFDGPGTVPTQFMGRPPRLLRP